MPIAKFNKLDAEFENLLVDVLSDVNREEFTAKRRSERRKLADASDLEFARIYFPQIFELPFNDVHRHIASLESGLYTISGFPKSGKTAFTFVSKIIKPIAQGISGILNVTLRTQDIARERTYHLYRLITRNKLLMYDYEVDVQQEQKGYYIFGKSILVATSIETGLRNFVDEEFNRFKISVADDTYNRVSASSENDNEKTTNFLTGELYRQMEDDGLSIVLGNRINEDCPIVRLEEKFPDRHFSFPVKNEEGRSNWSEKYTDDDLISIESETDWDVWQGEWMDEPAVMGDVFDPDWLSMVNINLINIIASVSVIDPAHGSSPSACNKGIASVGTTSSNEVTVLDMYLRKEDYLQVFDYVSALRIKMPHWKCLLFENDFAQWNLAEPYYATWMNERKDSLPIITFNSKDNKTELRGSDKISRILNLVHPHQKGLIRYNDLMAGTSDFKKYKSEYLAFGKSKRKLDGLDALASAYILIFRYINQGTFKPTRSRQRERPKWLTKVFG
jgi:hypothetical protein